MPTNQSQAPQMEVTNAGYPFPKMRAIQEVLEIPQMEVINAGHHFL